MLLPLATLGVFLTGVNPIRLIIIGGIVQAVFLPVAASSVLYLRFSKTDVRLRPGKAWDTALIISCASLVAIGIGGLIRLLVSA